MHLSAPKAFSYKKAARLYFLLSSPPIFARRPSEIPGNTKFLSETCPIWQPVLSTLAIFFFWLYPTGYQFIAKKSLRLFVGKAMFSFAGLVFWGDYEAVCEATHILESGTSIRYIQELLGHKDIKTTRIYTHVTTTTLEAIQSPLDKLPRGGDAAKKRNDDGGELRI